MNRHEAIPVTITTIALFVFAIAVFTENIQVAQVIFMLSPLLIIWMVYSVVRFGKYKSRELTDNEEWGYADKGTDELNTF